MENILGTGPGWCGAGGPWIDPARSMQHLCVSPARVSGPGPFTGTLPVAEPRKPSEFAGLSPALAEKRQAWHADITVLAFPTPAETAAPDLWMCAGCMTLSRIPSGNTCRTSSPRTPRHAPARRPLHSHDGPGLHSGIAVAGIRPARPSQFARVRMILLPTAYFEMPRIRRRESEDAPPAPAQPPMKDRP